jgi:hypothetical protein
VWMLWTGTRDEPFKAGVYNPRPHLCSVYTTNIAPQQFRPLLTPIIVMYTVADRERADRKERGHLSKQKGVGVRNLQLGSCCVHHVTSLSETTLVPAHIVFMEHFRYVGTNLTKQNGIQDEIRSSLQSGNACCHSLQNLLSSSLTPKNIKIKIYRNTVLSIFCVGV